MSKYYVSNLEVYTEMSIKVALKTKWGKHQ